MGKAATVYCEECLEDIPAKEVYWEGNRAYCGQCGGELDIEGDGPDLLDALESGQVARPFSHDEDDGLDELEEEDLDGDFLDEDDEDDDEHKD